MTEKQYKKIAPNLPLEYEEVKNLLIKYDINTTSRIAGLFSQIAHESGNYKYKAENLNYSARGLRITFKKYFPTEDLAKEYARNPEKIANRVYANRMGNGNEASGDGYKYRGRGYIQLTGKNNYSLFSTFLNKSIDDTIKYLETNEGAFESALYYWKKMNCNKYCDEDNVRKLTKAINGGYNGLEDRQSKYTKYKGILSV